MYLIDKTYFIKKINVANANEITGDSSENLEMSIDRYSRQFLQMTLGNVLFSELNSNVTDGVLNLNAPQKWLNLVNGCTYTYNGKDYVWKGLLQIDGLYKSSILAHFTYLNQFQEDVNSIFGQIQIDPKNGVNIGSTSHLVDVWNDFIEMYQGSSCEQPTKSWHSGVLFVDYYGTGSQSGYVSYLQFLKDNATDYENAPAGVLKYKNSLGI
jgi:hypothetical protein